jgi:aminoglycoside 6-adenylyltransferase
MRLESDEADVLGRLLRFATADERVRAVLLTSSRLEPRERLDILSDYDIPLLVTDPEGMYRDEAWLQAMGTPLLRVRDVESMSGLEKPNVMVLYDDGVKIDFSLWPLSLGTHARERNALPDEFDDGFRVLLDKDGLTRDWPAPSHRTFIPEKPTPEAFQALIEEFWWVATYVAKYLWRGEIFTAKVLLDYELKYLLLRRFLVWRVEIANEWQVQPGFFGRGLPRHLDAETWADVQATYVDADPEENWAALFRTIALFRRVARAVADDLRYDYPEALDATMMDYLWQIETLEAAPGAE